MLDRYPSLNLILAILAGFTGWLALLGLYYLALSHLHENPGQLDRLIDDLHRRYFVWRFALRCSECGRRGFVHSWLRIPIPQQIALARRGGYPTGAGCIYCGLRAIPIMDKSLDSPSGMMWKVGEWLTMPPDIYTKIDAITSSGAVASVPMDKIPTLYTGDGPAIFGDDVHAKVVDQAEQFLGELWEAQHNGEQERGDKDQKAHE